MTSPIVRDHNPSCQIHDLPCHSYRLPDGGKGADGPVVYDPLRSSGYRIEGFPEKRVAVHGGCDRLYPGAPVDDDFLNEKRLDKAQLLVGHGHASQIANRPRRASYAFHDGFVTACGLNRATASSDSKILLSRSVDKSGSGNISLNELVGRF